MVSKHICLVLYNNIIASMKFTEIPSFISASCISPHFTKLTYFMPSYERYDISECDPHLESTKNQIISWYSSLHQVCDGDQINLLRDNIM